MPDRHPDGRVAGVRPQGRKCPQAGLTVVSSPPIDGEGPLIFISAAEPSADLHGASLIRAVQAVEPTARFAGIAGPAMQEAGCWALHDMTSRSAMLVSALANVGEGLRVLSTTRKHFGRYPFDAAVLIDSPVLNLALAKVAKKRQVPVFYYIAPQVWAWARYRVGRVRRRVDRMAVILPFEERFFRERGIDASYVGHPLFDTLSAREVDPEVRNAIQRGGRPVVALIPGSRSHVVKAVLPGQLEVARGISERFPDAFFPISVANDRVRRIIEPLAAGSGINYATYQGKNRDLIESAELVLVVSGTSTLEVAYYHQPMVVMYNSSRLVYHLLARWLISTPHLSLVNILAERRLVPEFMPYYTSTTPITRCALELLESPERRESMSRELADLLAPMRKPGAPDHAAALLLDMIGGRDGG
ncbi:MAG: lipid-A-disaccharide synthase [bacterium]|nr:lipid-A-disaccharide synthase [bacterium]